MPIEILREKASRLPTAPGVYLFKDARGRIIYVGKANRIRDRVRSHLSPPDGALKQLRMLEDAVDVEVIVTDDEIEALTLENSLIKQHAPKFNVLLRDDKNYPYLRVTSREEFPRLELVRGVHDDGSRYFGPFIPASRARLTQVLAYRRFGVRPCSIDIDGSWERPCLYYDIGECAGPCVESLCTRERYAEVVDEALMFLEGRGSDLVADLEAKMLDASVAMEYERAAHYRDLVETVKAASREQKMASTDLDDRDLFAFHREEDRVSLQVFLVRRGLVVERKQFFWDDVGGLADDDLVATAVQQYYHGETDIPPEVCVPLEVRDARLLSAWLRERRGRAVRLTRPQRGPKRRLLDLVRGNAELAFQQRYAPSDHETAAAQLAEIVGLPSPPRTLECVDVSNIQGRQIVASLVRFRDGAPDKDGYRRFRVRGLTDQDDFRSIAQVVERHFARVEAEDRPAPDLLLVDGGRGQLGVALAALAKLGVRDQAVAAIEKGEEKLYLPGEAAATRLDDYPQAQRLVQRARDEAHRFAVTYHRALRRDTTIRSELETIPGIGPKRRLRLLQHFGSLARVREASQEELESVVGAAVADALRRHFDTS